MTTTGRAALLDQLHAAALESVVSMLAALRVAERALGLEPMPLADLEARAKRARADVASDLYGTDRPPGESGDSVRSPGETTDTPGRNDPDNHLDGTS